MRASACLILAFVTACSERALGGAGGEEDGSGDAIETGTASGSASATGSDDGDDGPSLEHCGDGSLDPGEACDDGNDVDADGCNVDCVVSGSIRWSWVLDSADCQQLATDAQGGVYVAGRTEPEHERWIAAVDQPGETRWLIAKRLPRVYLAPLIGFRDRAGFVAAWGESPELTQGLVREYDGAGAVRWETIITEPEAEDTTFVGSARAASGHERLVATKGDLIEGGERVTVRRFSSDGAQMYANTIYDDGTSSSGFEHFAIAGDGTVVFLDSGDGRVAAFSADGEALWERVLPDGQWLNDVDAAADGSFYAVSARVFAPEMSEFVMQRFAGADGSELDTWVHELPSDTFAQGRGLVVVDDRGDVHVVGRAHRISEAPYTAFVLTKYSADGELRWSNLWEFDTSMGIIGEDPKGLAIAANGDIMFAFNDRNVVSPHEGTPNDRCYVVAIAP